MHIWQLQEAKAKLSNLVKLCHKEPQIISIRGENKAILLSMSDYHQLICAEDDLVTFFRNSPLMGISIDTGRDQSSGRDIDL